VAEQELLVLAALSLNVGSPWIHGSLRAATVYEKKNDASERKRRLEAWSIGWHIARAMLG